MRDRWSQVSVAGNWWHLLDRFPDEARRRMATTILGAVPRFIHPSFDELYTPEYVECFHAVLAATSGDEGDLRRYTELTNRIMDLDDGERDLTPGAASLSSGIIAFLEGLTVRFDRDRTLEVLFQSYEAVLHATSSRGEDSQYSAAIVEFQREVIAREG